MREQRQVVARLDVERGVHPEKVRDAVLITVRIVDKLPAPVMIFGDRQGDRPSRAIVAIQREAETMRELIVTHELQVVRLIEIGGVPIPLVHGSDDHRVVLPQLRARVGIAYPAVQLPLRFLHHQLHAIGTPLGPQHVRLDVVVHQQLGAVPGFERGKYLINFHDFANKYGWSTLSNGEQDADYMWKKYDRAGFVEAIRVADTLYILRDEFKNLPNEKINFADLNKAEEDAWTAAKKAGVSEDEFVSHKYILSGDNHKYVTWSMRFVNKEVAANEVEADRAFLFESMKSKHVSGYNNSAMGDIAPTYAAWLRMQNGCLVLSDDRSSNFDEMNTGGDDALIFNVEQGDDIATDNETIDAVEGISVVAGNGTVTVQGAAGKSVVITNILGKVIAETVLTSDNATISVPAGIVAVAVDGEEAVKAIVK